MTTETFDLSNPEKPTIIKDPDAELDYTWDLTDWCNLITDTILSHTVTPDAPVTVTSSAPDGTNKKIIAILKGGTPKVTHRVRLRLITVGGRTDDRSIFLKIKER